MARFSERYGYVMPSKVIIREEITEEIENAICSVYDKLKQSDKLVYDKVEEYLWCEFLNQRLSDFYIRYGHQTVATDYISDIDIEWHNKLDLIEETIVSLRKMKKTCYDYFVNSMNCQFERLNFAYRIVDDLIVEITSEEEIASIQQALDVSQNGVRTHLHTALVHLSTKPVGDYRNSIKESISAVEAISREITGEKSINFKKMEEAGVSVPSALREAFNKLYGYTNDGTTGIRHALMDDTNEPTADEAIFMLVFCSAFINYLTKKISNK